MNPTSSRRLVLLSLGTMFGVIAVRSLKGTEKGSTYRRLWATGALAVLLSAFADFAPEVAGPLALLIGLTYVMGAEQYVADWLHAGIGAQPAPSTQGAARLGAAAASVGTTGHVAAGQSKPAKGGATQ